MPNCFENNKMSDGTTASPKKAKKPVAKKPADHPKYIDMIIAAIVSLKERNGSSRQAIKKFILANYKTGDSMDTHLKLALKRGVKTGSLTQPKGTGASGSFKVAKKPAAPKKKVTVAKKKPAAKKPTAKKSTPKKKTSAKKTPTKKAAAKKTTAKKASSAKKPATKKPATKKAVAKKPAVKKATKKTPKKGKKSAKK